ncbi:small RNA-binding protein 11, chloroplastic [Syzygium oleosum]|uniref:small RNA-binding protein 11, chloroplastic n=1 Tax=Syzygium oleosum TaxID=219896 RepID=UPI0011D24677|nr:small RNA-binding protein 11, chloroplastic [Syzygium oleosum]
MAAARRVSSRLVELVSSPNPIVSPASVIFHRGLASTLFVKGIDFATTDDRLAKAFSKFGQVEEATIIMDRVKNRSKGFGYVTFAVEEDARKALIDMNGKLLDGRVVFVDKARTTKRC